MSQHLILKCFLHSADIRDRQVHPSTQQHFHEIAQSLRKSWHFLDIKHKQQTLIQKSFPKGLGLELQSWRQQTSPWLNASHEQTLFGCWQGGRRQGQRGWQRFHFSVEQLCLERLESQSTVSMLIELKGELSQAGLQGSWTLLTLPGDISLPSLQANLVQGLTWSYPRFELSKWQIWKKSHLYPQNRKYLVPYGSDTVLLWTFPWVFIPLPPPIFVNKKLNTQDVSWRFWHGLIWIRGLMTTLLPTYRNFNTKLSYKNSCSPGFVCFLPNHHSTFTHLQTQK